MKESADFLFKAKSAQTPDEIFALARENNVEMTAGEANALFFELHPGELSDDDLDAVAGGAGTYAEDGSKYMPNKGHCEHYCCRECGKESGSAEMTMHKCSNGAWRTDNCNFCIWAKRGSGSTYLCYHPANRAEA